MTTLHGLKNCDTCRKADRLLREAGEDVTFRDVRAEPLSKGEIGIFLEVFGEDLLNRRSTTWRNLSDAARSKDAAALLMEHPALMKRPVIEKEKKFTIGWSAEVQKRYLG